jgi:hypothetical protein
VLGIIRNGASFFLSGSEARLIFPITRLHAAECLRKLGTYAIKLYGIHPDTGRD